MIRNVVLGRLKPDADPSVLDEGFARMRELSVDGLVSMELGRDAGLRPNNWDYAIVVDLLDIAAYRRYDEDEEHNRIRRQVFAVVSAEIARLQFEL